MKFSIIRNPLIIMYLYIFFFLIDLFRFVVDAADRAEFPNAKRELLELLTKPQLANIPLLLLGNKNDLPNAAGVDELIEVM